MKPDDPVCLCFHVTRRKIVNFIRVEKPQRLSQLSQCFGAGTGCGWCRDYLGRLLAAEAGSGSEIQSAGTPSKNEPKFDDLSLEDYARGRSKYVQDGGGTPPAGATPIDPKVE